MRLVNEEDFFVVNGLQNRDFITNYKEHGYRLMLDKRNTLTKRKGGFTYFDEAIIGILQKL